MALSKKKLMLIIVAVVIIAIAAAAIVLTANNSDVNNVDSSINITGPDNLLKNLSFGTYESDPGKTGFSLDGILTNKDLNLKDFEGYTIESKLYKDNEVILNKTINLSEAYNGNEAMTLMYDNFDNAKKPDKAVVKVYNATSDVVQTIEKKL